MALRTSEYHMSIQYMHNIHSQREEDILYTMFLETLTLPPMKIARNTALHMQTYNAYVCQWLPGVRRPIRDIYCAMDKLNFKKL